jgi:VanZ family protein
MRQYNSKDAFSGGQYSKAFVLAVGSAGILSISTELTQIFSNSRFPSMTDVVCNAIGAFAGAYLAISRRRKD